MDTEKRRWGRAGAPTFCAIPAAGSGEAITGVPIASGPVSWVLLGLTLTALVFATGWLMRRWSVPSVPAAPPVPAVAVAVHESPVPVATAADDEERELARL